MINILLSDTIWFFWLLSVLRERRMIWDGKKFFELNIHLLKVRFVNKPIPLSGRRIKRNWRQYLINLNFCMNGVALFCITWGNVAWEDLTLHVFGMCYAYFLWTANYVLWKCMIHIVLKDELHILGAYLLIFLCITYFQLISYGVL